MREIKFRGIRKVDGKPMEGCLIQDNEQARIISKHGNVEYNDVTYKCISYEIIPETVGQYTGLKDKNGVEIYEGDIVRIENKEIGQGLNLTPAVVHVVFTVPVVFEDGVFGVDLHDGETYGVEPLVFYIKYWHVGVIGNKHDKDNAGKGQKIGQKGGLTK